MNERKRSSQSLYDLYNSLGLNINLFDNQENFSIFNLNQINFSFPFFSNDFQPDFFSFLIINDGDGAYTIDDQVYKIEPKTFYFTNPSSHRSFSWKEIQDVVLITFDEDFIKTYINQNVLLDFPFLISDEIRPQKVDEEFHIELNEISNLLIKEFNKKYPIIGHLLGVLLHKIKINFNFEFHLESDHSNLIVNEFKHLLETNFRDLTKDQQTRILKTQDYASLMNLHPTYLNQIIKSKINKNITNWISSKMFLESKVLLKDKNLSIKEISYRLQFSETSHFSNFFKKNQGISSQKFRKEEF